MAGPVKVLGPSSTTWSVAASLASGSTYACSNAVTIMLKSLSHVGDMIAVKGSNPDKAGRLYQGAVMSGTVLVW